MKPTIIFMLTLIIAVTGKAQENPANEYVRQGNALYKNNQYTEAESSYRQALTAAPADKTVKFNLASSLYRQDKQKEAMELYSELETAAETSSNIRGKAWYNSAVMLTKQGKLEESVEAYKQALRLDPNDQDARENLQKVLLELKKRQPKKEKESPKKNQKEKEKSRPKMNRRQVEQQLKLLELKEQQVKDRLQKNSNVRGSAQAKDW